MTFRSLSLTGYNLAGLETEFGSNGICIHSNSGKSTVVAWSVQISPKLFDFGCHFVATVETDSVGHDMLGIWAYRGHCGGDVFHAGM